MLIKRHCPFISFSPRCYLLFSLIPAYFISVISVKFKLKRAIIPLLYIGYLKVKQSNSWILQSCYDFAYMVENNDSWSVNITQELQSLDLGQMWDELILYVKSAHKIIEEKIYDTEKENMLSKLSN